MPNATKNAIRVACVAEVEALRAAEIAGSAGKYMSIAKGPMAVRRPNTIAFRTKVDGMSGDHQLLAVDLSVARAVAPLRRTERRCDRKFGTRSHRFPNRGDHHKQVTDVAFVMEAQCPLARALKPMHQTAKSTPIGRASFSRAAAQAIAMPIYTAASDLPTLRIEVVSVERGAIKMVP
jgi:hypothetical protein